MGDIKTFKKQMDSYEESIKNELKFRLISLLLDNKELKVRNCRLELSYGIEIVTSIKLVNFEPIVCYNELKDNDECIPQEDDLSVYTISEIFTIINYIEDGQSI